MDVNKLLQYSALAAFVGAGFGGAALADESTTGGGFKIKSDDGKFDFSLGGRIHFDTVVLFPDDSATYNTGTNAAPVSNRFGSNNTENTSGTYFRRVFLTLGGHLYGFEYRIETNIAGNNAAGGNDFQDVWILKTIKHDNGFASKIWVGQHKVWRGMEEIGSNNNTLFMERGVTTASGIYGGRDFAQGVFYSFENPNFFLGPAVYSLHKDGQNSTQGLGYNGRAIWAPINEKGKVLSVGGSYSSDHADNNNALSASYRVAGYRLGNGTVMDTFANYTGNAVAGAAAGTTVANSGGRNSQADTIGAEAVGIFGPFYLNGEYAHAKFKREGSPDAKVDAFYVQGSWFVTGETKTFGDGKVVGGPKVTSSTGALELKVKYEYIENGDVDGTNFATLGNAYTGAPGAAATFNGAAISPDKNQYSGIGVGANYYINPAMRVMLDYTFGQVDLGRAGKDEPSTLAARIQLAF